MASNIPWESWRRPDNSINLQDAYRNLYKHPDYPQFQALRYLADLESVEYITRIETAATALATAHAFAVIHCNNSHLL